MSCISALPHADTANAVSKQPAARRRNTSLGFAGIGAISCRQKRYLQIDESDAIVIPGLGDSQEPGIQGPMSQRLPLGSGSRFARPE
jgi:hypothetical protein